MKLKCTLPPTPLWCSCQMTMFLIGLSVANVARLTMRGESSSNNIATIVRNGSVGFSFTNMVDFNIYSLAFTSCNMSRSYGSHASGKFQPVSNFTYLHAPYSSRPFLCALVTYIKKEVLNYQYCELFTKNNFQYTRVTEVQVTHFFQAQIVCQNCFILQCVALVADGRVFTHFIQFPPFVSSQLE